MCNRRAGFLLLTWIVLVPFLSSCALLIPDHAHRRMEDARSKEADELIAKSPVLQELEHWCEEVPLFASLEFQTKRMSSGRRLYLGCGYKSSASWGEVKSFYESHFESNGWSIEEDSAGLNTEWISFVQPDRRVTVNHIHTSPRENFVIECGRPTARCTGNYSLVES